jgi:hypothetical protein
MSMPRALVLSFAFGLIACSGSSPSDDSTGDGQEDVTAAAGTVEGTVSRACSTSSVHGLAQQLIDEIECMAPGTLRRIDGLAGVHLDPVVFPYLQTPAAHALRIAGAKTPVHVESALRTIPQQYLLYRWYQGGRCSIRLAARVGHSNHEQGLAVDISEEHTSAMTAAGFRWFGSGDPVHNDYVGDGTVDLLGLSTRAFQRLWNLNHANDRIAEDGDYGPQTEARLKVSPAAGFAHGATCDPKAGTDGSDPASGAL